MSIAVSIVEDDAGVRGSLARLIDSSPGFRCVSQHPSAESALQELPKAQPEVVLMDINLPGLNGVECVRRLKPLLPRTQVIMLTVYQNTEHIFNALTAGATGYMLKQTPPAELLAAIRDVHAGGSPMNSHIARKIVQSFQKPAPTIRETDNLSPREAEVLALLAKGYLYKEIADKTGLTYATVHTHIRHIYEKLQVRSRTEAVAKHLGQNRSAGTAEAL
ncbi:MAG TPA: response regulator transcription factor [Candidatus Sulfotelmatobacter sp.]|nr:response regulator transcription factor [Candidatus Sulfotelmatobacter sp.]HWI57426.1 response regulator transcription factor [Bacillota bacterium]